MPNHVTTTMRVRGPVAEVSAFRDTHIVKQFDTYKQEHYETFDFQTVIPQPACLKGIEASSSVMDAIEAITGKTMAEVVADANPHDEHARMSVGIRSSLRFVRTPEQQLAHRQQLENLPLDVLDQGLKALQAVEECGYPTWYEWSIANWGTKWGAYDLTIVLNEPGQLIIRFETAWTTPDPIFIKLAEMHPLVTFTTDSFDEGWGFATHGSAKNGTFTDATFRPTNEAYELAYGHPPLPDDEGIEEIVDTILEKGEES